MKKKRLKEQKGFAASDALIAVLIIALFSGLIATISYNIYLSNSSIKRMSKATEYITNVFEHIDKVYYDEVTIENLKSSYTYLSEQINSQESIDENMERLGVLTGTVENSYEITIIIDKYNLEENSLDLVKQIKMRVKYKLGNKDQIIEMKKIKQRENLITPNIPKIELLELQKGYNIYPIKEINNTYTVCNLNDSNWYNYENDKYAKVVITANTLEIGDVLGEQDTEIYMWIPRYAQNSEGDIKYLYSNTNTYVSNQEGYQKLIELEEEYTVNNSFIDSALGELVGIWEAI